VSTTSRPRPRVSLLLDPLSDEYTSMVVAAFDSTPRSAAGEQYGSDRLRAELEAAQHEWVTAIVERLLAPVRASLAVQEEDIALLVARHQRRAAT